MLNVAAEDPALARRALLAAGFDRREVDGEMSEGEWLCPESGQVCARRTSTLQNRRRVQGFRWPA